jgi:Leucine-rich repeat (LRR) protein
VSGQDEETEQRGPNRLSGCIPQKLGNLVNLKELYLHRDDLTGSIPCTVGNLTKLSIFYLYENQFSGYLPRELGYLVNLEYLKVSGNKLIGYIPNSFGISQSSLSSICGVTNFPGIFLEN